MSTLTLQPVMYRFSFGPETRKLSVVNEAARASWQRLRRDLQAAAQNAKTVQSNSTSSARALAAR